MIRTATFSAVGDTTAILLLRARQTVEVIITNTGGHAFSVTLDQEQEGNQGARTLATYTANQTSALTVNDSPNDIRVRLRCAVLDVADGDTIAVTLQDTIPTDAVVVLCTAPTKAGATAGWLTAAGDDIGKVATLPASKTASTLVMRIPRLKIGDRIVGHYLIGSIQSVGGTATVQSDLRSLTAAGAGATDASVAAMAAAVSVTANTVLSKTNTQVKGIDHVVAEGESLYMLITGTTAASTTEEIQAVALQIVPASTFG